MDLTKSSTTEKDSSKSKEETINLKTRKEIEKEFCLKELQIKVKDVINSNQKMPKYSKPGPFSTKILTTVQKVIKVDEVPPPATILPGLPITTRAESRDSISIEVIDEFVVDEISPYKPVATIKVVDSEEDTGDEESSIEEIPVEEPGVLSPKRFENDSRVEEPEISTTTKSGRKVTKPKLQNFVTSFKEMDNLDSEFEDIEDDDASILSQNKYGDDTGDDSCEDRADILTTTKSGRKVTKPKLQNVVTSFKGIKNLDSEIDTENDEETVLSKEKLEEYAKTLPVMFEAGDLAWARIGVAPFWPCTITRDPDEKIHSTVSMKGKRAVREYHVQVSQLETFIKDITQVGL